MTENLNYKNNVLYYDNVNLNDISKKYYTPMYIYSKAKIIENCNEYHNAFKINRFKNYKIHYAIKANNNLSILKLLLKQNLGIDAVSIGEIQKAKFAGFDYKDMVFSGVGKTKDDLIFSVKNCIGQINVESFEEIKMLISIVNNLRQKVNIAIRVNPDIQAHTNEKISTGSKTNKFGINSEKLNEAITLIKTCKYLHLIGLSIHIGSQLVKLEDFEQAFSFMSKIYKQHPEFTVVDLGGGLGIKYNNTEIISKKDYVSLIAKYFADFKGTIIIEPGRSIIGDAGIFLTKIIRIKHTDVRDFIVVDGGMNSLVRPAMYGSYHQPMLVRKNDKSVTVRQYDIVGPICESGDVFCKEIDMEEISNEDNCIAFLCAGAYGKSMASIYNLQDIAMEIMVDDDKVSIISQPIRWKDLIVFEQ